MDSADLEAVNDRLTLVEFAVQDLMETKTLASARRAFSEACALCLALGNYVTQRKEQGNGNRIQSGDADRQSGQRPQNE